MPEMIHNYWIFAIMFVGTLKIRRRLRTLQRLTELAALTAIILRHSPTLTELRSVIFASLHFCISASLRPYTFTPLGLSDFRALRFVHFPSFVSSLRRSLPEAFRGSASTK